MVLKVDGQQNVLRKIFVGRRTAPARAEIPRHSRDQGSKKRGIRLGIGLRKKTRDRFLFIDVRGRVDPE
jgi:hypothetical protein